MLVDILLPGGRTGAGGLEAPPYVAVVPAGLFELNSRRPPTRWSPAREAPQHQHRELAGAAMVVNPVTVTA